MRCLVAGMDDYLAKPIRLEELRRALGDCRPVTTHPVRDVPVPPQEGIHRDVLDEPREDLGDPETLLKVAATFLDRTPLMLTELRDAAARKDRAALLAGAHGLKGTSAMLGALALSEQCVERERLAWAGNLRDVQAQLDVIAARAEMASRAFRSEIADS